MAITSATYKLVRPTSKTDSNYEDFEFLLAWYSRSGQYINYMFTDWENEQDNRGVVLNRLDSDKIEAIHASEERQVNFVFENITKNDLIIYSSILSAKKVLRVFKDGSTERVGVNPGDFRYRQTAGRYNLEISVTLYEKALPR